MIIRFRKEIASTWQIHHDNAPNHRSAHPGVPSQVQFGNIAPAPALFGFGRLLLFPRIKTALKGFRVGAVEAIKTAMTKVLNEISVDAFQDAYRTWKNG